MTGYVKSPLLDVNCHDPATRDEKFNVNHLHLREGPNTKRKLLEHIERLLR